jgi:hypothetical protein
MARTYLSKWKHGNKAKYKLRSWNGITPKGYEYHKISKKHEGIIFKKKEGEK